MKESLEKSFKRFLNPIDTLVMKFDRAEAVLPLRCTEFVIVNLLI